MLKAQINNVPLITDSDFSCHLQVKNPACMFDELSTAKAADITVPKRGNQATLRNPDRFTKRGTQNDRQFDNFRLIWNGINLISGTFIINDPSDKYSGWAQSLLGKLADDLKEKLINQIDLGEQTFTNKATFDPLSDLWCTIRLKNKGYFKDIGKRTTYRGDVTDVNGNTTKEDIETELLTYKFLQTSGYFVNAPGTGGVITSADENNVAVVSPYPFLHSLVDSLLRANQFYMADNFLKTDPDLQYLCLYHTWNILAAIFQTQSVPLFRMNYFMHIGQTRNYDELVTTNWSLTTFLLNELLPDTTIGDFMLGLQNTTNTFFWFDNHRQVRLIDREGILTGSAYDLSKYQVSDWIPGERKNVRLKFAWEHDSNDTAFQDVWADLSDIRDRIKGSVNTREDLDTIKSTSKVGDIWLVEGEGIFYEFKWFEISSGGSSNTEESTEVLSWKETSINLQDYYFNDGDREEEEIKSIFSTLRMDPDGFPIAFQVGNNKSFSRVTQEFSPRMMFFKGNNAGGDESPNGMKFTWDGDQGILRNRWRLWAPFWANRLPVKAKFEFTASVFNYVLNNIYQKFRTREGEFIIEELNADPGPGKTVLVEISGFKVEDNFWEFNPGVVAGGGDGTNVDYNPVFIGTTASGKPYAVEVNGKYYSTSIFGVISQTAYAKNNVVAYNALNNQLYVGGANGFLHIYDCTSPTFPMKSVQIFDSTDDISCVKLIGDKIFIGRENAGKMFVLTVQAGINDYTDLSATAGTSDSAVKGYYRDFMVWVDASDVSHYYAITSAGEFVSSSDGLIWTEVWDVSAGFTRFGQGGGYFYIFDSADRCFYSNSAGSGYSEFDVDSNFEPAIIDAVTFGNQVVAISEGYSYKIFFITSPSNITSQFLAATPRSVVVDGNTDLFACYEDYYTHAGKFYKWNGSSFIQQFLLPDPLTKLFNY